MLLLNGCAGPQPASSLSQELEKTAVVNMEARDLKFVRLDENGQLRSRDYFLCDNVLSDASYTSKTGCLEIEPGGRWKAVRTGEDWIEVLPQWDREKMKESGIDESKIPCQNEACLGESGCGERVHIWVTEETPVWSLKNPQTGQYLLTDSKDEWNHLMDLGWQRSEDPIVVPADSSQKVIRLNSPDGTDTIYTMDPHEIDALIADGWTEQETRMTSDPQQGIPVYCFSREVDGTSRHFYTARPGWGNINMEEWQNEGIAFYALSTPLDLEDPEL